MEVVASLFLVGTLMVGILTAHRRSGGQMRLAERRLTAIETLNALMEARERPDADDLHRPRGKAPGANSFHWRSTIRRDASLERFGVGLLRIELFDPDDEAGKTLAHVEVLAPSGGATGSP